LDFFNSQQINLPNNIIFPNPFLTWNQNLEKNAYKIIKIQPISDVVLFGLNSIGISYKNSHKWHQIRCDFLSQRCFQTATILKNNNNYFTKLTAVINKKEPNELYKYDNNNIDAVTYSIQPNSFKIMPKSRFLLFHSIYIFSTNIYKYENRIYYSKNQKEN
jgi:hypothetical protein